MRRPARPDRRQRRVASPVGLRPRAARLRGRRDRRRRASVATRLGPGPSAGARAAVANVGGSSRRARLRRTRGHRAVVPPSDRGRARPFGPPRRAQHRDCVGQVAGLSAADPVRADRRPPRPGAVSGADEGARPRPAARGSGPDRRDRRVDRRRAQSLRRGQHRRGPPLRQGAVALDLLQPRHDPSVAAAQPCPLGGVLAAPALHRRRRMPLLPWDLRIQRGAGAAPADPAVRQVLRGRLLRADGDPGQRDGVLPRGHRLRTARPSRGRGDRGRLPAGWSHGGALGTRAAHRSARRERGAGPPLGWSRGRPGDGRLDDRGGAHADVRPVAPRRGTPRTRHQNWSTW